jgi:hypothetical protein
MPDHRGNKMAADDEHGMRSTHESSFRNG